MAEATRFQPDDTANREKRKADSLASRNQMPCPHEKERKEAM